MSEYFPTKFAIKLAVGSKICDEKTEVFHYHQKMEEIEYEMEGMKEKYEKYKEELDDEEYIDEIMESKLKRLKRKYKRNKKRVDTYDSLIDFQNLSVSTDFKSAMIAFDGIEISEEQSAVLEKIHESTYDWVKGRLIDKMISKIDGTQSAREIKDLTDAITILMNGGTGSDSPSSKIVSYVVNTVPFD